MFPPVPELGRPCFAQARETARTEAIQARRRAEAAALTILHDARERFADHAGGLYANGASAAARDGDLMEDIADRIATAIEALQPIFDRLDVARDLALYRGPVLSRARSRYDATRLTALTAEVFAEELLSGPAGAVLIAAIGRRALCTAG
jgi:hypothetical protein